MKSRTLLGLLLAATAQATPSSSSDYAINTDTLDFGGQLTASADYSCDGSMGLVTGISGEASTPIMAKSGYVGQLYEVIGYAGLVASNNYPDELGTTQLFMVSNLDDGTTNIAPPVGFTLSVLDGPLTNISITGLVTAGAVHEHTEASVAATSDLTGQLTLLLHVQDSIPDNFGTYAGDGLPDSWQIEHFGLGNPLAAPLLDPDGDGQNNRFEYTAGIIPTDPLSRFLLSIKPVPGTPTHMEMKFSPVYRDRTYTVKSNTTLGGTWEDLTGQTDDHQQPERTIIDQSATTPTKFYHIEITKP